MLWWLWITIGFGLIILELFIPSSFYAFFLGLAAIITGILVGLISDAPTWIHWAFFSFCSVILIVLFRNKMSFLGESKYQDLIDETVLVLEDIEAGASGQGELRGTRWNLKNTGTEKVLKDTKVKVKKSSGLTIEI